MYKTERVQGGRVVIKKSGGERVMLLRDLIEGLQMIELLGEDHITIKNIVYDSRKVVKGSVFVCIEGFQEDGHQYAKMAEERGAVCIIAQKKVEVSKDCTVVMVEDTREASAFIADKFYAHPTQKLSLVGVTGTKGKTTTTYMIKSILECQENTVGLIGTITNSIGDKVVDAQRTTPEAIDLQGLFARMVEESVRTCVMEVSSHALELKRVKYSDFKVGIFTNLSRDHMDFHQNFESYFLAKAKLFEMCEVAVVNIDTDYGRAIAQKVPCQLYTIGIENHADLRAKNVVLHKESVEFDVQSSVYNGRIKINIPGIFTVYNALCALGAAIHLGVDFRDALTGLSNTKVPGRAEVVDIGKDYTVMIDYAHTPDSLQNILTTVKQFSKGRLISVFGCGGDRDRTKRPLMGKISGEIADFSVITSDNPRTEEPLSIIREIEEGIKETHGEYILMEDRRGAIRHAMQNAKADDVIVIAGKGHETYQILADRKVDFDEQKIVKEIAKEI
jgi:UDP-N-acetylmuramoyl-L-alanyl-D-glutamate--2,6-diaminopimelate ligase